MWKPRLNFLTVHYIWIVTLSILSLVIIYPYGNLKAVDAYFFGASASTESGLNTINLKALKTYQQVYLYLIPVLGNLGFINIVVVVVRLHWFEKRLKAVAPRLLGPESPRQRIYEPDLESEGHQEQANEGAIQLGSRYQSDSTDTGEGSGVQPSASKDDYQELKPETTLERTIKFSDDPQPTRSIQFADEESEQGGPSKALYIPPPWKRDQGSPIQEVEDGLSDNESVKFRQTESNDPTLGSSRRRRKGSFLSHTIPLQNVASMMFVVGGTMSRSEASGGRYDAQSKSAFKQLDLPNISSQATQGRNSQFYNLTAEDRDRLGGIEYRSLKLLLKIVTGYFFGLHLFGAICLVVWIKHANPKYREYLADCGQGNVWWGFYSAQTMVDNLGFTLTPDSMIHFQDATFPLIVMSFLGYAGNTCYPCVLRLVIWIMFKLCPQGSSMNESLNFLLAHPRRCYTHLFPARPTWVLFGILFIMNFIDIILILVLDLHNPAVSHLPAGPRVMAAIFQAASTRHTGAATFNLGKVNPAVQFSLVVMMYIAAYPIAISIRASNTYEESSLGIYSANSEVDETSSRSYVLAHIKNQLTFDLWYISIGVFCICIAEAGRIMNVSEPAFSVFSVIFEVVSGYANVGLSLGYANGYTSLSGKFTTFSKLVICAMMIRGRHRGMPYKLDRAIVLPSEHPVEDGTERDPTFDRRRSLANIRRYHTN